MYNEICYTNELISVRRLTRFRMQHLQMGEPGRPVVQFGPMGQRWHAKTKGLIMRVNKVDANPCICRTDNLKL